MGDRDSPYLRALAAAKIAAAAEAVVAAATSATTQAAVAAPTSATIQALAAVEQAFAAHPTPSSQAVTAEAAPTAAAAVAAIVQADDNIMPLCAPPRTSPVPLGNLDVADAGEGRLAYRNAAVVLEEREKYGLIYDDHFPRGMYPSFDDLFIQVNRWSIGHVGLVLLKDQNRRL
jgi:hypothetical protein